MGVRPGQVSGGGDAVDDDAYSTGRGVGRKVRKDEDGDDDGGVVHPSIISTLPDVHPWGRGWRSRFRQKEEESLFFFFFIIIKKSFQYFLQIWDPCPPPATRTHESKTKGKRKNPEEKRREKATNRQNARPW